MQMLWVDKSMCDVEPDKSYLLEIRYDKTMPQMEVQGEQQDLLASMASGLRENFLQLSHFQKQVSYSISHTIIDSFMLNAS